MPTILSDSLERTIIGWMKRMKLLPILISFFLVIFTLLFVRDLAQRSLMSSVSGQLPYPGIRRDHPLYPLKQARDFFLTATTRDLIDRAVLHVHLADKAMGAAQLSNTCDLALIEAQHSSAHLREMKASFQEASERGMRPEVLTSQTIMNSLRLHRETLTNIEKRCAGKRRELSDSSRTLSDVTRWFSTTYQAQ